MRLWRSRQLSNDVSDENGFPLTHPFHTPPIPREAFLMLPPMMPHTAEKGN